MGILVVVATVGINLFAFDGLSKVDGVIAPLPHESAAGSVVGLDNLEIILQITRAVAHGVAVLAHHKRLGAVLFKIVTDLIQRRIHPALKINDAVIVFPLVGHIAGTLVMGETGGIKFLRPSQRLLKGAAVSALISHGPDHDAGAVFVTLHAALGTVHSGLCIQRIVRNDLIPAFGSGFPARIRIVNIRCSVTLIVRLIDNEKAQTVIELIKMRRVGIMAGADRIHVVFFHQGQILLDLIQADGKTSHRIAVVAVGSVEFDLHTVDVEHAFFRMDLAYSHLLGDSLLPGGKNQFIEIWILCTPEMSILHRDRNLSFRRHLGKRFSLRIGKGNIDRHRLFPVGKINGDRSVLIILRRNRFHKIVLNSVFRTVQKIDIAENAAHTEFVLILKIASVTPFHHQNSQRIFALAEQLGHVKLTGGMGNLTVAHKATVHPHIKAGVHTLEIQVSLRSFRVLLIGKIPDISAAGVHHRNIGWIHRERITDIRVLVMVIAVILPDTRHFHLIKGSRVIAILEKFFLYIINILEIMEFPVSGKQKKTV